MFKTFDLKPDRKLYK